MTVYVLVEEVRDHENRIYLTTIHGVYETLDMAIEGMLQMGNDSGTCVGRCYAETWINSPDGLELVFRRTETIVNIIKKVEFTHSSL